MTRIERLEAALSEYYRFRAAAGRKGDFAKIQMYQKKIDELQAELIECRRYQPMKLRDILDSEGEDVKNRVYKVLLKISLAADFANECAEQAKSELATLGLNDFSLRGDVEELCRLSQKIASFVIIPNQNVLTDMMTDNSDFIGICDEAADRHLNDKLKL